MSKLAYICNSSDAAQIHEETTPNGIYYFIRKNDEKTYLAYRLVDRGGKEPFYVQVNLPAYLYKELILSGKIKKAMGF